MSLLLSIRLDLWLGTESQRLGYKVILSFCILCASPAFPCLLQLLAFKVKHLASHPGVHLAEFDQCRFGLCSVESKTPIRKRTKVLTSSLFLHQQLDGKYCDGSHDHQVIQGSEGGLKRSVAAQVYPDELVHEFCQAALHAQAAQFV